MDRSGFTLMEVLVATAIVGIALGVALAAIANGRGQMWRGQLSREAAEIAKEVAYSIARKGEIPVDMEPKGHPGWRVSVQEGSAQFTLTDEASTLLDLGEEDLRKVTVTVTSPDGHNFVLSWIERGGG